MTTFDPAMLPAPPTITGETPTTETGWQRRIPPHYVDTTVAALIQFLRKGGLNVTETTEPHRWTITIQRPHIGLDDVVIP